VSSEGFLPGDSGSAIESLTAHLVSLGLLASTQNAYDSKMEAAIRALQQNRGLKVTGVCDPKTLQALEEARWKLGDRRPMASSALRVRQDLRSSKDRSESTLMADAAPTQWSL